MENIKTDVLVIGGGPAGIIAGQTVRRINPNLKIMIVKKEKGSIIRCSEPYVVSKKVKLKEIIADDKSMITEAGINFLIDEAIKVNPKEKVVITKNEKKISYKKLILATGAYPFVPPIENVDFKNVFTLRGEDDVKNIQKFSKTAKSALVVGGGAIGLEIAAAFKERNIKTTIVEFMPHLIAGAYDEDFSLEMEKVMVNKGVKLFLGESVKSFLGRNGKAETAITSSGKKIKVDLAVVACGVRSETKLAKEAGLKIGKFGIEVNDKMETSEKDIYAIGDCAQAIFFLNQKPAPSQLATTAVIQGKIAGKNAAGKKSLYEGTNNAAVSAVFGVACGRVGFTEAMAEKEGIEFLVGRAESFNKYECQPDKKRLSVKLIFNKEDERIIGAQIFGGEEGVSQRINLLSLAIQNGLTRRDLAEFDYCAHPELTPLPFAEPIVIAAEMAR